MIFKKILESISSKEFKVCQLQQSHNFFKYTMTTAVNSNSLIVVGPNGCGKSLLGRIIETVARTNQIPCRSVAVRNRTASGVQKAFIFGDESRQSTGFTSVEVCNMAMNSAVADKSESILVYDEPDLGLSDGYSYTLGQQMGVFAKHHSLIKSVVISHNRHLVRGFLDSALSPVNVVSFDPYPPDIQTWLQGEDPSVSYSKLLELTATASQMESVIDRLLRGT